MKPQGFVHDTETQQAQLSLGHQAIFPPSPSHELRGSSKELLGQSVSLQPLRFATCWLGWGCPELLGFSRFLTVCFLPLQCQSSLIFQCSSKLLPAPGERRARVLQPRTWH